MLGECWKVKFTPALSCWRPLVISKLSCNCSVFTSRDSGKLLSGPYPDSDELVNPTKLKVLPRSDAAGKVPNVFSANCTLDLLQLARNSLAKVLVKVWFHWPNTDREIEGTLTPYPWACSPKAFKKFWLCWR